MNHFIQIFIVACIYTLGYCPNTSEAPSLREPYLSARNSSTQPSVACTGQTNSTPSVSLSTIETIVSESSKEAVKPLEHPRISKANTTKKQKNTKTTTTWSDPKSMPNVKKSKSGLCHPQGSSHYARTKKFVGYPTLEACIQSGGKTIEK